jgi:hypothetical protein
MIVPFTESPGLLQDIENRWNFKDLLLLCTWLFFREHPLVV